MASQNTLILPHTEAKRRFIVSTAVRYGPFDNLLSKCLTRYRNLLNFICLTMIFNNRDHATVQHEFNKKKTFYRCKAKKKLPQRQQTKLIHLLLKLFSKRNKIPWTRNWIFHPILAEILTLIPTRLMFSTRLESVDK